MTAPAAQSDRLSAALAGRYRIERELGAGGMATVYLAFDEKHDRKVAIKVLKPELAAVLGAERFVVEIKTTAAMSHPHILPLFDSGTADGFLFYVMPYIQGETIRERLNRETQFGVDEAVRVAREIADALDYAHRHGVIHRDIKPENILLHDGRAMVMDFGIALAVSAAAGGRMTETGLSLGTPHYMSPEQATADKTITARSDVYSLASVLYEMLAGEPPHTAGNAQAVIMKIITDTARPVSDLRRNVPANVSAALGTALEKLPADRFESARAFADALAGTAFTTARRGPMHGDRLIRPRAWSRATTLMAAIAAGLALALGVTLARGPAAAGDNPGMVQFALVDAASVRIDALSTRPFAFSPDGRSIVFRASGDSAGARLWIRTLGDPTARPIEGTQGGMNATFSPDGEWIAFITENTNLKKVRVAGGPASPVVRLPGRTAALAWGDPDEILFEQLSAGQYIHRVSASGGRIEPAVPLDSANGEEWQRRPFVIPGTRTVVYVSSRAGDAESVLALYRLSDGRRVRLDLPGVDALGYFDGRLVYSRADGTLLAVPLDVGAMKTTGMAVPLEPRVRANVTGTAVALSRQGTLAFHPADADGAAGLALLDTGGRRRTLRGTFAQPGRLVFSPDGRRVVIGSRPEDPGWAMTQAPPTAQEVHVFDLTTQVATRLRTSGHAHYLSWSADGRHVLAPRLQDSVLEVMRVPLDGAPESKLITIPAVSAGAVSATPDGRALVFSAVLSRDGGSGLFRAWLDGSARVDTLMLRSRDQVEVYLPRVSPDGRSVAFVDRGSSAVFVKSLAGGGALQVSEFPSGFRRPVVWSPDSRHVSYIGANGLNIIEIATAPTLRVVDRRVNAAFRVGNLHDVAPDGRTFITLDGDTGSDVRVALNWVGEARRVWSKP